eukprot:CAMPEP_0201596840 /NCGR_PEP_ID=MMETSP0190_2-20130828/193437_1 /ASSEMBLY_ACC=CAM_ASM_000263 /TAXON_ID=37353 /ORGANISM="Rosalina sp." /LENGTH=293 /DNA_ID=CAMNT_0048057421 /DNA_START=912 /DNA_END=1793 /DNA_ORIENTATION=-
MISGNNFKGWSIPADKVVVGKFIRSGVDGSAGWMSGSTLNGVFDDFIAEGTWNAGFMTWQYIGDKESNFAFSNTVISAFSSSPVPAPSPVVSPVSPPSSPVRAPTPTARPTPAPTAGGTGGIITVTTYSDSTWWWSAYLSNYGSNDITSIKVKGAGQWSWTTATISWYSNSLGPVYGCSPGPSMVAPIQIKLIRSDGSEISGATMQSRAAGASATFGSSFSAYDSEDDNTLAWPAYFAIIMCLIVLIGCIVAGVWYKKKKAKKEVTFTHGDKDKKHNHAEIQIGDGANTNTQI